MTDDMNDIAALHKEDVDDFLAHFGVKGMHWGRTRERGADGRVSGKSEPLKQHSSYTNRSKGSDEANYGSAGSERINASLHKGLSIADARAKERGIKQEISRTSGLKPIGAGLAGAGAGIVAGRATVKGLRAVAYSPTTLKVLGKVFENAPFGVKAVAVNGVIGARLVTDIANSKTARLGLDITSARIGAKVAYNTTEKFYTNKAVKKAG